eukprot:gnl/TRDRNA2_/TRDRNA2_190869_c0_seq1.p1 gnl/TRDRNA2_/TRDRNA2_190869_c0~~gnl/TRDRNA2_/TRDRNA2_190869_c0_seq1.p1  ORF type:complete len:132 (-),score=21.04 gnl/TRDRNA2_/TRDRNA2_190869_c0_seq1:86-481(-)
MWSGMRHARWGASRNLAMWCRTPPMGAFQAQRTVAAAPALMRLCAEVRPAQGFAEQIVGGISGVSSPSGVMSLEESLDDATCLAKRQAELLESLIASTSATGGLAEIFDIWMALSSCHRSCLLSMQPSYLL